MTHAFVTLAIPFAFSHADAVDAVLETMIPELRGKNGKIFNALEDKSIHFLTITVVRGEGQEATHLLIECSADGDDATAIATMSAHLAPWLTEVMKAAQINVSPNLNAFLSHHHLKTGQGLFDTPGLNFTGHPGMTVKRITEEYQLARAIRTYFGENPVTSPSLQTVAKVRAYISTLPEMKHLLEALPLLRIEPKGKTGVGFFAGVVARGIAKFLWPLLLVLGVATLWIGLSQHGFWPKILVLAFCLLLSVVITVAALAFLFCSLRKAENANQPDDSLPDPDTLDAVMAHENQTTQNHLAGISRMQPGWVRFFTLRIAFWVIGQMATHIYKPGFLADIGTIHFARWVLLPKTNKLLFFSNYGGSWESYLEDFITKAANGLTGAWSNTIGFPKTKNLFQDGATDGDRFKRWARRQQQPTRFWYSAYPHLTTARVRNNAAIRQGLGTVSTSDEASAWLSLFGSAPEPATAIETREVQSLMFGGFSNHAHSTCLILQLPKDEILARKWLAALVPDLSFGDDPPRQDIRILSLSYQGLEKLNLPTETLSHFPIAFRQGMAHDTRARILSDTGQDAPQHWHWGRDTFDASVLLYASDAKTLLTKRREVEKNLQKHGGKILHKIDLAEMDLQRTADGRRKSSIEAFGFADGISQPIIRGSKRFLSATDSIHVVEPGEFLLGYPNNHGDVSPPITIAASADPNNVLPVANPHHAGALKPDFSVSGANAARDFARNGSYLVIRQLDQKTDVFESFTGSIAEKFRDHPGMPKHFTSKVQRQQWIAAKMVGRWKDGTSLVRYPHRPGTGWKGEYDVQADNDFLLGNEDPAGLRCPYGAHVRRANPRDSFEPGSKDQLAISNRHRILRVGRNYSAKGSGKSGSKYPGLLFMCFNADIERQFEFIQQTWAMAWQFHGLENEVDPLLARGVTKDSPSQRKLARLTIPTREGAIQIENIADFIDVRGGGYFFMPSRSALRFLSS